MMAGHPSGCFAAIPAQCPSHFRWARATRPTTTTRLGRIWRVARQLRRKIPRAGTHFVKIREARSLMNLRMGSVALDGSSRPIGEVVGNKPRGTRSSYCWRCRPKRRRAIRWSSRSRKDSRSRSRRQRRRQAGASPRRPHGRPRQGGTVNILARAVRGTPTRTSP